MQLLDDTLKHFQAAGLIQEPNKAHLGPNEVQYLAHVIFDNGLKVGSDRDEAIMDFPQSTTIKELDSVLDITTFVPTFIHNYAVFVHFVFALERNEVA